MVFQMDLTLSGSRVGMWLRAGQSVHYLPGHSRGGYATSDGPSSDSAFCWVSLEADPEVRISMQGVSFGVDPVSASGKKRSKTGKGSQ